MNSEEESDSEIDEGNVLDSDDSDESDGRRTHEKVTGDDFLGSDDGSEEEELPIERQARQLDDQAGREEREDAAERRAHQQGLLAPDAAPDATPAEEPFTPIDLEAVKARIHENVRILENFKALSKEGKTEISRSEYVDQLQDDMAGYYGYLPFLIGKFLDIFSPSQTVEFLEANETDRPVTIRTNTLRSRRKDLHQALQNRGMRVEPMDKWSNVGMVVYQSPVPIGATPEYLAGHYIIQSAASFLPCMALGPAPGERVLDMCAAPGGKAAYLAALMKNTGVLFANDQKLRRIKALNANLHRLGVSNSVITNYDGRQFPTVMRGFDRCLLDAPCTGLGVIAKDPAVKMQRDEEQLLKLSHLQKELLLAAIDCVDQGERDRRFRGLT
jgi:ribosomal RNA methyltransferase Nop2